MNPHFLTSTENIMSTIHHKDISFYNEEVIQKAIGNRLDKLKIYDEETYSSFLTCSDHESIELERTLKNHY